MEVTDLQLFIAGICLGALAGILKLVQKYYLPELESKPAVPELSGQATPPVAVAPTGWKKAFLSTKEFIEVAFTALVLALIIRTFVIQAFKIPSASMEDTLLIGDHLLVTKFIYGVHIPLTEKTLFRFRPPKRDEIFVFRYPLDPSRDFIKRCVGIPGDIIELRNKNLYRNGQQVDEPYVVHKNSAEKINLSDQYLTDAEKLIFNYGPITVPANCFFAMGDNRDNSSDSRFWGFVPYENLRGKPLLIYWPPKRIFKSFNVF